MCKLDVLSELRHKVSFLWMELFTTLIREAPGYRNSRLNRSLFKGNLHRAVRGATSEDDGKGRGGQVQGRHVRTTRQ